MMRDISQNAITQAALASVSDAKSPRAREINEALIRHLHAFVCEVEPTPAEWAAGIDFLTRVGRACTEDRQEFILLSDVLGVTMLIDTLRGREQDGTTESTVLGPFYVQKPNRFPLGANLAEGQPGEPLFVSGTVSREDGRLVPGASIDIWHSDGDGFYDVQKDQGPCMRGRLTSNTQGEFWFWTVMPCSYPVPHDGPSGDLLQTQGRHPFRPAHIHFRIEAPGCETLVTQIYAADDNYLDSDAVFGVKSSLIRDYVARPPGTAPNGRAMERPYRELRYEFVLKPALVESVAPAA